MASCTPSFLQSENLQFTLCLFYPLLSWNLSHSSPQILYTASYWSLRTKSSWTDWCTHSSVMVLGWFTRKRWFHHHSRSLFNIQTFVLQALAGPFTAHANVLTWRMPFPTSNCYCIHPVNVFVPWIVSPNICHNLMSAILCMLSFRGRPHNLDFLLDAV